MNILYYKKGQKTKSIPICFLYKCYIYTNKPSKVLFALTKLLMTDEVTRIDGIRLSNRIIVWPPCSNFSVLDRCMTEKQIEVSEEVEAMEQRLQPVLQDTRPLQVLVKDRLG